MFARGYCRRVTARFVAAGLALFAAACTAREQQRTEIVGPVWVVEDIAGAGVIDGSRVTLVLMVDGQAGGSGGCNSYGGSYLLEGRTIRFEPLAATRMACAEALMEQEQRYFDMLAEVGRFAVAADGALLLMTPEGREIRFRRE